MLRIIAGSGRGRRLLGPGKTCRFRPTEDRTREALFNILGSMKTGPSFLDLFAGSGAVGLEAWSRGYEPVVLVERNRAAARIIEANVAAVVLGRKPVPGASRNRSGGRARPLRSPDGRRPPETRIRNAFSFVNEEDRKWDVIFCDPPYDMVNEVFVKRLMSRIDLAPGGVFVLEHRTGSLDDDCSPGGWTRTRVCRYGGCSLSFFRRLEDEE